MSAGFVIREKGEPRVLGSARNAPTPHRPRIYTYSVKVVFGHLVTHDLEGEGTGPYARVFASRKLAEDQRRAVGDGRWVVLSMETARRDQAALDAENAERREKRKRWEVAIAAVGVAERDALAALRAGGGCCADLHQRLVDADRELAEAAKE